MGDYDELLDKNGAFADFLRNYAEKNDVQEEEPTSEFIRIAIAHNFSVVLYASN